MLQDIHVGDVVRVDDGRQPWRVEGKTRKGMLTLEALGAHPRITWEGVHEFRVERIGVGS